MSAKMYTSTTELYNDLIADNVVFEEYDYSIIKRNIAFILESYNERILDGIDEWNSIEMAVDDNYKVE